MRDATLRTDSEMLCVEFHVLDVQIDEFLQSDAGPEEQLDDDSIPGNHYRGSVLEYLEKAALLRLSEKPRQVARKPVQCQ